MRRIAIETLTGQVRDVFVRHRTSPQNASIMAENCVGAERDGASSHGLFRLRGYVDSLESGWVDGFAEPALETAGEEAGTIRVDARNGFAQPALRKAFGPAVDMARKRGVCLVTIRDSHHFGALWPDVEPFARCGLVALCFVNSMTRMVPWGGHTPVYGTNPMAFAVPRPSGDPVVFDQASSAMAFGDIKLAAASGEPLPEGCAVDRDGLPTTDAAAVVAGGALLPFGGHKGSSIAMMVELLCAGLTGGSFSFEIDQSGFPGAQTPRTGETLVLVDPERAGQRRFAERAEQLFSRLGAAGQERLPGDRRYAKRRQAEREGIPVDDDMLASLKALAAE